MDFTAYIAGLPAAKRALLYRSPWTSLAVFRNLPPLAQAYVMRLLFVPAPFPAEFVDSWCRPSAWGPHRSALEALRGLDVLVEVDPAAAQAALQQQQQQAGRPAGRGIKRPAGAGGPPGRPLLALQPDFRDQLQRVVCEGSTLMGGDVPASAASATPSLEALSDWAGRQWEALQLYMLGATRKPPGLPQPLRSVGYADLDLRALLMEAGLLALPQHVGGRPAGGGGGLAVTRAGFQFLLQPRDRQLWAVLREYISGAEASSGDELASSLSFLLQLGFRRVGQAGAWGSLRPPEQRMAAHLVQLGLLSVGQAVDGALYYTPTHLASSLCGGGAAGGGAALFAAAAAGGGPARAGGSGAAGGGGGSEGGGAGSDAYIIVESNYRVYAYTRSPVTIAVLELFVRREALLPNLFVGSIRRDSILSALARGITAAELVAYLAARPHPAIASRTPVVPEVVSDQIKLWEDSLNRLTAEAAVLYENMESRDLYERAVSFSRQSGTLLWEDAAKMRFVALDAGHEAMKGFIMRAKQDLKI
ncbi:hypothetical protein GPECTOR_8g352 [Gonium pectorale]|uniref:RNA polymerase II transcription factor B subunit 2 n=1 Tax=Gonium pectorale TaxID=33097 RepID=A0A150GT46_GONPE|nr:hypothetical protein GPECTOR_8g352 [Gonium pectorale]|eukprot:KXZ52981.1 hypothetical protein GPECTOR_8g352 [Gonium pectorale]